MYHPSTLARHATWFPINLGKKQVPGKLLNWLVDPGSLTTRLVALSHGKFEVKVLRQSWGRASLSEAKVLGIKVKQRVLIREVVLCGAGSPWVYARSILPSSSLVGPLRRIRKLDNRPLGAWLFRQPSMRREPMQFAQLQLPSCDHFDAQKAWGRRSVFYVDNKPLLVSEMFLEQFSERLKAGH